MKHIHNSLILGAVGFALSLNAGCASEIEGDAVSDDKLTSASVPFVTGNGAKGVFAFKGTTGGVKRTVGLTLKRGSKVAELECVLGHDLTSWAACALSDAKEVVPQERQCKVQLERSDISVQCRNYINTTDKPLPLTAAQENILALINPTKAEWKQDAWRMTAEDKASPWANARGDERSNPIAFLSHLRGAAEQVVGKSIKTIKGANDFAPPGGKCVVKRVHIETSVPETLLFDYDETQPGQFFVDFDGLFTEGGGCHGRGRLSILNPNGSLASKATLEQRITEGSFVAYSLMDELYPTLRRGRR
jgi:hypothetical protein